MEIKMDALEMHLTFQLKEKKGKDIRTGVNCRLGLGYFCVM